MVYLNKPKGTGDIGTNQCTARKAQLAARRTTIFEDMHCLAPIRQCHAMEILAVKTASIHDEKDCRRPLLQVISHGDATAKAQEVQES